MKALRVLIILLLMSLESNGQDGRLLTTSDTVKLLDFAHRFGEFMNSRNFEQIREMSFDLIHCRLCIEAPIPPSTSEYYYISVDTFLNAAYRERTLIKLWNVVGNKHDMIDSYSLNGPFRQRELKGTDVIIVLEVFFLTLKPDEYEKGHEGQQTALQFVKVGDNFKFYGIDTVP